MNIRPSSLVMTVSVAFVFVCAAALADDSVPVQPDSQAAERQVVAPVKDPPAKDTPVAAAGTNAKPAPTIQLDPFLGSSPSGNLVVWSGREQVPMSITVKSITDQNSAYRFEIIGKLLFFIEDNNLRTLDLKSGQVKTVKAKVFKTTTPEQSLEYDGTSIVLSAGITEYDGVGYPNWIEAEKHSFPVPADSGPVETGAPIVTCAWQDAVETRVTLTISVVGNTIYLVTGSNKGEISREKLIYTDEYKSCLAEMAGEEGGGEDFCSAYVPSISCSQMRDYPYSFCEMVHTGVAAGPDSTEEHHYFWFNENLPKLLIGSTESGERSPGGCWNIIDDKPFGPWPAPEDIRSLSFIQWL